MRVVVMGAAGGVGRRAVEAAVAGGHTVVAASRAGTAVAEGAEAMSVDVRSADAVERAVRDADAVLWCIGVTRSSGPDVGRVGMAHLVGAATRAEVGRVVTVSGAGVTLPSDRKGAGARFVSGLTKRLARDLVTDKEAEHAALLASSLGWTEVRPPRLSDGDPTGRWQLTLEAPGLSAKPVPRSDVAAAMLSLAVEGGWEHQSPFITVGG